jgi:hypothetical protein
MLALLVVAIARRPRRLDKALDLEDAATVDAVRACALAGIISSSLISGTADPGIIFFISLAVVTACAIRVSLDRPVPVVNWRHGRREAAAATVGRAFPTAWASTVK